MAGHACEVCISDRGPEKAEQGRTPPLTLGDFLAFLESGNGSLNGSWSQLGDLNVGKKPRSSKPTAASGCALALLGGVPGPAGRPACCQARGQAAGWTVHACGLRGQRADVEADAAESFPKQGLSPGHLPNVPVIWEDCKLKSLPPNEWG